MWSKMIPFEYLEVFSIFMFLVPPIVSLITLYIFKKKIIWLSIPIMIIVDVIVFWELITYHESQGIALLFLIPQIIVIALISLFITYRNRQKE